MQLIYSGAIDQLPAGVEINADRGTWQVLLGFDCMNRFHSTDSWAAYLDGGGRPDWSVDRQVRFILERGVEAAEATRTDADAERRMIEAGRARVERWYEEQQPGG